MILPGTKPRLASRPHFQAYMTRNQVLTNQQCRYIDQQLDQSASDNGTITNVLPHVRFHGASRLGARRGGASAPGSTKFQMALTSAGSTRANYQMSIVYD